LLPAALVVGVIVGLLAIPSSPLATIRADVMARLSALELAVAPGRSHAVPNVAAARPALSLTAASPSASPAPSPSASSSTEDQGALAPAPAPTDQPFTAPPVVPVVPAVAGSPQDAVSLFYQRVAAHDFAGAAALWSPRMLRDYPPPTYLDQRFAQTSAIDVQQAQVLSADAEAAIVAVDLVEIRAGQTYHWIGSWRVVSTDSGWLLDQPRFVCCQDGD
jgi:hypothetical protein